MAVMSTKMNILLLFCVFLSYTYSDQVLDGKKAFSIEEVVLDELQVAKFSGKWISDSEIVYTEKSVKDVMIYDVFNNINKKIIDSLLLALLKMPSYTLSADRKFALIRHEEHKIFRHSRPAKYVIYSIKDGNYYPLSSDYLQIAEWGPKGNTIVYVKDNNIYAILKVEKKMKVVQITHDGTPGLIINGVGDWVYQEEIFYRSHTFWFSPDGGQLAFLTLFENNVKTAPILEYGAPNKTDHQYPTLFRLPYPKPGSPIPTYQLRHVSFDTFIVKNVEIHISGMEIFSNLRWIDNESVMIQQKNRVQNKSVTSICDVKNSEGCRIVFQESKSKGWIGRNFPMISEDKRRLIQIKGVPVHQYGKYKHLVLYTSISSWYPLTSGRMEVLKIVHWDEQKQLIYYAGTEEKSATTKQIYVVSEIKGSKPVCFTCGIKTPEGRYCKDAAADFSKNSTYVIVTCHGPDPRVDYLFKNQIPLGNPLAVLEGNEKLRIALKEKIFPDVMNLTVDVPGPFKADVRLLLPPNMDRSGKTKYPMLIYVYGGPASKNIHDAFKLDWGLYMSTNLSVIYGMIDGRNTLRKGENMLFAGYRALGTVEMEDQINVTRTLQKTYPFIDSTRTGIWGWSYGGYATTKILELDTQNIFKCGVAVAPVADWMYYDSMYTERYMGLPQDNKKGYETSSVLKDVSNLRKKQYFLIHGNADDNVHYQHAMMIAKLLQTQNIPFEAMSYPDEDHNLNNVAPHLYFTMRKFWKKCFNLLD